MTSNAIQQSKARPVIYSLLTLLSGIIIGAGVTLIFVGLPKNETIPPFPEEFSQRMAERMTRELALTPEQQEAIQTVIEIHMTVIEQIRGEARPLIRQELDAMNNEMLALMDENQQQQWKESIERMQRWWRQSRERRGPRDRDGDRRGPRDRDDRERFRPSEGPGGDPNSPFFRRRRGGDGPGGDPNSPFFRRRRFRDDIQPGDLPPNGPRPDLRRPQQPVTPTQPPQEV